MSDPENAYVFQNRISDMETTERPRERLAQAGAAALSNYELLAILLRVGMQGVNVIDLSKRILNQYGGLNGLKRASYDQLKREKGIGAAKAAQLMAAIELGRRLATIQNEKKRLAIHSAEDVFGLLKYEMGMLDHEELWIINLDTRHNVLGIDKLYKGSINTSTVRIAELFQKPISRKAAAILMVHNHPSGDPKPSPSDILVTKNVKAAGKLLEIDLLDHIIIGEKGFTSIFTVMALKGLQ